MNNEPEAAIVTDADEEKIRELKFGNLNALIIEDFINYLEANSKGEGANSYYACFIIFLNLA